MCRIGPDRTRLLPQRWHYLVPTLREKHAVYCPFLCDPEADVPNPSDHWVWQKLTRPDPCSLKWATGTQALLRLPPQTNPNPQLQSLLFTLPTEIIFQILVYLDRRSVLSLAVSCVSCLNITIPHVQQRIVDNSGPWSNQPLACLGTRLTTLPAAFENDDIAFRSVETEPDLRSHVSLSEPSSVFGLESGPPYPARDNGMCIARRYNGAAVFEYSGVSFSPRDRTDRPDPITAHCFPELQQWVSALDAVDCHTAYESTPSVFVPVKSLRRLLSLDRFYGPTRKIDTEQSRQQANVPQYQARCRKSLDSTVWYLRNHDTKEYIRLIWYHEDFVMRLTDELFPQVTQRRLIGVLDPQKSRSHDTNMTIERVMAVRTYWPDGWRGNRNKHLVELQEQQRRSWAGHRFDVVTSKMHNHEHQSSRPASGNVSWTDATEESLKLTQNFNRGSSIDFGV